MLMKLSPFISELSLYDVANTPGVACDLSHISTGAACKGYLGPEQLPAALAGVQLCIIPAGAFLAWLGPWAGGVGRVRGGEVWHAALDRGSPLLHTLACSCMLGRHTHPVSQSVSHHQPWGSCRRRAAGCAMLVCMAQAGMQGQGQGNAMACLGRMPGRGRMQPCTSFRVGGSATAVQPQHPVHGRDAVRLTSCAAHASGWPRGPPLPCACMQAYRASPA